MVAAIPLTGAEGDKQIPYSVETDRRPWWCSTCLQLSRMLKLDRRLGYETAVARPCVVVCGCGAEMQG
jgi:hypothetical protein